MPSLIPNILIVESNPGETELVMGLIAEVVRANVDSTNSGERAIELFTRTQYQIVIADCGVSDMDGLWILDRLKRVSPSTSVILTSSFGNIEEAVKSIRNGAEDYFKKPFNPEHFKLAVRRCLDKRELYSRDKDLTSLMNLLNTCQLVSGSLEEEKVLETVTGFLRRETSPKALALYKFSNDQFSRVATTSDLDTDVIEVVIDRYGYLNKVKDEVANQKSNMILFPKSQSGPETAVFSFSCTQNSSYYLFCISPKWNATSEDVQSHFRTLQAQIQMTGRNIDNYRGVRHLLYLDEPTGLYNTRYMHIHLKQAFEKRAKDENYKFSVLFIDIDKFKCVNDGHGHLIGTKILFEMGQLVRAFLKQKDIAFRYGGDEFVIFLDNADSKAAHILAEALRKKVEAFSFITKEALNIKLTISVGIASCPEHATSKKAILEAADAAMYSVKKTTRNHVYVAEKKAA